MGLLSDEKRKNDEPRRFQWWLLVIGIALGVLVSLVMMQSRSSGTTIYMAEDAGNVEGLYLTATRIIEEATGTAQAGDKKPSEVGTPSDMDSLYITATHIVEQATQQAASTPSP